MLQIKEVQAKVTGVKEVKKEEKHIKFYSPRSGRRYRFYYAKFLKRMAKYAVIGAVSISLAYFAANSLVTAWDKEYEMREKQLQEWNEMNDKYAEENSYEVYYNGSVIEGGDQ